MMDESMKLAGQEADPEFLSQLSATGRAGLWHEKAAIERQRQKLEVQTRDLAFAHYPTFIAAADCCQEIARDFQASQDQLSQMIARIPQLVQSCQSFKENVQQVSMHRKRTSLVLAKHPKLLEVLELPQLMDTCVKNGHHEEALAIQQLCTKLQKSLGNIPLIKSILNTVHTSSLWMLNQLLSRLKCQIQLPECLKIIGYIRRMGAFNETQLRLKFLQAREAYFNSSLQQASAIRGEDNSADKQYAYLCRVIELTRICIFDAITQYRALFSDEENLYTTATSSSNVVYRHIFPSWLSWKLNCFLNTFKTSLSPDLDEQSMDSLIGQAMYFGQSLGRVGYDFRVLLIPIFLEIILQKPLQTLKIGLDQIEASIKVENLIERFEEINISLLDTDGAAILKLNFYFLAEMCNTVIEACNKLRYSTPMIAQPIMVNELQAFVDKTLELIKRTRANLDSKGKLKEKDKEIFDEVEEQFLLRVVPFCNKCKAMIFNDEEAFSLSKFTAKTEIELALREITESEIQEARQDLILDTEVQLQDDSEEPVQEVGKNTEEETMPEQPKEE